MVSTLILKRDSSFIMLYLISSLTFLLGLSFSLGFSFWYFRKAKNKESSELADLQSQILLKDQEIGILNNTKQELIAKVTELETLYSEQKDAKTRFEQKTIHLQENLDKQQKLIEELEKRMLESFSFAAQKAIEGNSQRFLDMAKNVLNKESEEIKGNMNIKQKEFEGLVGPLKDSLERYQKLALDMEKERQRSYSQVENELKQVAEAGTRLTAETQALKNALKKPHVRGRWGEVQLMNCIELAGMSEYSDVSFQDSSEVDGKVLRPDMIVRMPGGRVVVVDAKTPIDAFLEAMDASTEEERNTHLARHGAHVKDHVKKLAQKAYQEHVADSADFTVMFLPNESFLYAALETQRDLVEYALEKKILIATPPTLIGLLKVIRYGWHEDKLTRNAQLISDAGKELHKRLVDFVEAYANVGKFLDKAKSEYETGFKRLNSRVLVQARKMESLGAKGTKELPPDMGYTSVQEQITPGPEESL